MKQLKQLSFSEDEISLIITALKRMQLVSYACILDNQSSTSSEVFFKISLLLSKLQ